MNWVRNRKEVARLVFKRRGTAVLKSNLIPSIEFGTTVARRLKGPYMDRYRVKEIPKGTVSKEEIQIVDK